MYISIYVYTSEDDIYIYVYTVYSCTHTFSKSKIRDEQCKTANFCDSLAIFHHLNRLVQSATWPLLDFFAEGRRSAARRTWNSEGSWTRSSRWDRGAHERVFFLPFFLAKEEETGGFAQQRRHRSTMKSGPSLKVVHLGSSLIDLGI